MKTIEERAKEHFAHGWEGSIIDAYVQGATEQKAVDDKECETMVGAAVREAQQVFVNKACEIYEKELRQMTRILNEVKNGAGDIISIDGSLIQFRKAME